MPIDYTEQIKLIALKIRALRKARKLTVQELAYRCDIERSNLSRIETGRSNPTVKTLCIICTRRTASGTDRINAARRPVSIASFRPFRFVRKGRIPNLSCTSRAGKASDPPDYINNK